MLPFLSHPEPAVLKTIDHPLPAMQNLLRMLYVSSVSRVVFLKLSYLHWWLIRSQFPLKPLSKRFKIRQEVFEKDARQI